MALASGTRLGPYEIQSALGAGGMGEVYRARDTRLDRTVAVKVLPAHVATDPHLKQRFEAEAKTLAALSHPHICPVYDVGQQDGVDFLVMEYLEGETLAQLLTKGALPLAQALKYAVEIADALDKAHKAGIVHRDLKPGNIMLTKSGTKLLDFGLAKLHVSPVSALSALPTQDSPVTMPGTILGTLQYMAPEQLEGHEADARTDIFAFGAVVYEMVTGRRAFEGKSQASLIGAIMNSEPAPLAKLQPTSPPPLERLIKTCLIKDPDERWQSAKDIRRELEWIVGGDTKVGAVTPMASAPRPVAWRRAMPWVAGIAAASVLTGIAVWNLTRPESGSSPTVSRFVITPPESAPLTNLGGRNVIISPDGRRIVYVGEDAKRGRVLFVRDTDALEVRAVPGTENATDPFFSPDGAWIGFERGTALVKVAASGGPPVEIVDTGAGILGSAWGVDDTVIFAKDDGLYRVSAGGGGSVERLTPEAEASQGYISPRVLPGGKAVVFYLRKGSDWTSDRLAVLSLEAGEQRILIGGAAPLYASSGHLVFVRGTTLMAVPFDLERLEVTGDPVALLEGITRTGASTAQYWLSENGTLVYRPGTGAAGGRTLAWVGRDGGEEALAVEGRDYASPRVSPDGQRVAVWAAQDIWIYNLARGTTTRLTFDPATDAWPLWTPDGERVVFASNRSGNYDLYSRRADGTGPEERLTTGPQYEFPESWGNGGRDLVFLECRAASAGPCDVSVLSMAGERQTKVLLQTEFNEGSASVSPDGRWLAYDSNESGQPEIYVRPFPDVERGRWQVSTGGGTEPLWGPKGNELFYRTPTSLVVVPVQTGGSPTFGNARTLFNLGRYFAGLGHDFDIAPKGDRFILAAPIVPEGGASAQIVVVQNWLEELRRLVPTN
ncbi:MAG: protein kinase [Acidobacteria bacterium]|nr:protein kinase [Acidobacteriota bacterium]